jgi:hypothetical protein
VAGGGRLRDVLDRRELRAGVVLGDVDQRRGQRQADHRRQVQVHHRDAAAGRHRAEDPAGHRVEQHQRNHAGDDEPPVQRVHDLAAVARLDEEAADDRRDDRHAGDDQRVDDAGVAAGLEEEAADQHRGNHGDGESLEQVRRHAGAVADVVADVVGDHRRVARVVLRDAGLDLADQVGADVGALGEDAAAESGEDRDQRRAEGEADHRVQQFASAGGGVGGLQDPVEAGHADQAQADDQQSGDGAAAEGDVQGRVQPLRGGLRRANVRPHRDVHADVAGRARQDGAEHEADRRPQTELRDHRNDDRQHHADDGDRAVLAIEVGLRTLLHGGGDLLHPSIARGLLEDPRSRQRTERHGRQPAEQGESQSRHGNLLTGERD